MADILEEVEDKVLRFGHFFFSSRRRHTRYWRDWSSDVCSSDLSSSSPSISKTISAGRSETRRAEPTASKKAARAPLELAAPRATTLWPAPGTLAVTAAKGGEDHPGSSAGCTSYIP